MAGWVIVSIALLVGLNVFASLAVLRSHSFNRTQGLGQILLIWSLPIVGATISLAFLGSDSQPHLGSPTLESSRHPGAETHLAQVQTPVTAQWIAADMTDRPPNNSFKPNPLSGSA